MVDRLVVLVKGKRLKRKTKLYPNKQEAEIYLTKCIHCGEYFEDYLHYYYGGMDCPSCKLRTKTESVSF